MPGQTNTENPFYNHQADEKWTTPRIDDEDVTNDIRTQSPAKGRNDADSIVRETEDASIPDKQYSFDEDNTGNEEYHDADSGDAGDHAFDI